jgi:hypothetical protein
LLVGSAVLAGWVDRLPRRAVMIGCDVAAAGLTAAAAVPGLPVPVLLGLVFCVGLLAGPFDLARTVLVRDLFDDDEQFTAAATIRALSWRSSQVAGYAAGGVLVAAVGPNAALLVDAATYLASAAVIRLGVTAWPATTTGRPRKGYLAEAVAGTRLVISNPQLRTLLAYGWLAGFHIVPVAVVAPYTTSHDAGPATVGLLLAAPTAGTATSSCSSPCAYADSNSGSG